ncbi:MAG: HlyD family efflux transporter periplasmic adaptor subunit [Rhizobiaceae bacterium]|jgi:membrane fusion protein (multidrug efflux system)
MNARVEVPADVKPAVPETSFPPKRRKRRMLRLVLMICVPLLLAIGGAYFWLTGGRYIETDNAYVKQTMAAVSSDVAGKIIEVDVRENQKVKAGDVLFKIDPEPFRIAVDQANAALANARLQVKQLHAAYATAEAKLKADQATAEIRHRELTRSIELNGKGFAAASALDESRLAAQQADAQVELSQKGVDAAAAALDGNPSAPIDAHPTVQAALAAKEQAMLDLARTTVKAPKDGIASQVAKVNVGQYVSEGTEMLSLVETSDTWIEANFKETQLTDMHPGQPVVVTVDTYPGLKLDGKVESIGAGTGSEFSLIPAQNATGNWVKIVQRIPVRVRVDQKGADILRAGMSSDVTVDTGKTRLERGIF